MASDVSIQQSFGDVKTSYRTVNTYDVQWTALVSSHACNLQYSEHR